MSVKNFTTDGYCQKRFDGIYEELDSRLLNIETEMHPSKILQSLIQYVSHLELLANEYPLIKLQLDDTRKLWDVARQLIMDKGLIEDFFQRCDEAHLR